MIAHHEQGALRDQPARRPARGRIRSLRDAVRLAEDVGLDQRDVVDVDQAVPHLDLVARHADHPLDERHRAPRPRRRWIEDDDVAVRIGIPVRRQLVHEHVLLRDQGVLHRALLHLEGLGDEGLDSEEDEDREDESLEDLEHSIRALVFGSQAAEYRGCAIVPPRDRQSLVVVRMRRLISFVSIAVALVALGLVLYNATLVDRRAPGIVEASL